MAAGAAPPPTRGGCGGSGAAGDAAGAGSKLGAETRSRAPVRKLTIGVPNAALDDNPGLGVFVREVARRSGGRLVIVPRAVGYERELELPDLVRAGTYDLAWGKTRIFEDSVPVLAVFSAPFLIDSYALQRELLARGFHERLLAAFGRSGLRGLAVLPDYLARPFSTRRPLRGPADWFAIDGFGDPATRLRRKTLRALGVRSVIATRVSVNEALRKGATAGFAFPAGILPNSLGAFGITVTANAAGGGRVLIVFGNGRSIDGLTDRERRWLRAAGRAATRASLGRDDGAANPLGGADERGEAAVLARACRLAGVRAVAADEADLAQLRRKAQAAYRTMSDPAFRQAQRLVERVRATVTPRASSVPEECRGPVPDQVVPVRRSTAPRAVNGVYRYRTTVSAYVRAGLDPQTARDSAGTSTVTLAGGRETARRRGRVPSGAQPELRTGHYRVTPRRVTFYGRDAPITVDWRRLPDGSLRFDSAFALDPAYAPDFAQVWRRIR